MNFKFRPAGTARRIAVPADLSPVLNIAVANQPAQVIGRKSDGRQRVDLDGEIPQVALHVAGVIVGFRQPHHRRLNRGRHVPSRQADKSPLFFPNHR